MQRYRSGSEESDVTIEDAALQGAEVLLGLRFGSWQQQEDELEARKRSGASAASSKRGARDSVNTEDSKPAKAPRTSCTGHGPTRSYVWRGPHRGGHGANRKSDARAPQDTVHDHDAANPHSPSSRGSSEDDESSHFCLGHAGGYKHRDKEWAALTTWLRMNLHHPRTLKKLVLFVGSQAPSGDWEFDLNPGLSWDDVSVETKLRLKMLPEETETAFAHKYPERPSSEWAGKQQKYKVPGSCETHTISLANMVNSLRDIYFKYEPGCCNADGTGNAQGSGGASERCSSSSGAGSNGSSGDNSVPSSGARTSSCTAPGGAGGGAANAGSCCQLGAPSALVRTAGPEGSGCSLVDEGLQLQLPYLLLE